MSDQPKTTSQKLHELTPLSKQVVRIMMVTTIGAALLGLSSLTLTGTVVALIIATPFLVILSPILVPAVAAVFLITIGFLFSGGCGVAAIAALTWMYNYVAGKQLTGADKLNYARIKIASTARDAKEKAKGDGQQVQDKAQAANRQVS